MYKIQKRKNRIIFFKKNLTRMVCVVLLAMVFVVSQAQLFNAFEAHIINVTAKIVNDVPNIDPPSGEFCNDGSLVVTLSATLTGTTTTIYYTTDGSDPDCHAPNGSLYADPFPLTYSATVKARTCHERDGELLQSAIMSETYDVSAVYCDSYCGDGIVDPGEQCDDGNLIDGDGCNSDCSIEECGPCDGKITSLTMQYNGTSTAVIKVVQKSDGVIVFNDAVNSGEQFSFVGTWGVHPTLGTEITIYIDDVENVQIHTSCSAPVGPGMIFGDFLIIAGESRNGGPLCPGVVLNEFLPDPIGDDAAAMPNGEWVELYNLSAIYSVNLAGYYLTDAGGNRIDVEACRTNTGGVMIRPNDFLVVYRKGGDSCTSHNFSLNNDNDTINFFDYNDNLTDSHSYSGSHYDSLTPTPGNPNYDDSVVGSGSGAVPENKSYARIPDGIGEWVDPVPTPGAPNILEEYEEEEQDFSAGSSSASTGASESGTSHRSAAAGSPAEDYSETGESNPADDADGQTADNSGQTNGDEAEEDETDEDQGGGADKDGEEDGNDSDGDTGDDSGDTVEDDGQTDDAGDSDETGDTDDEQNEDDQDDNQDQDGGTQGETADDGADTASGQDGGTEGGAIDDDGGENSGDDDADGGDDDADGGDDAVEDDGQTDDAGDSDETGDTDGEQDEDDQGSGADDAGDSGDSAIASGQDNGADTGAGGDQNDQGSGTDDSGDSNSTDSDDSGDMGGDAGSGADNPDTAGDAGGGQDTGGDSSAADVSNPADTGGGDDTGGQPND